MLTSEDYFPSSLQTTYKRCLFIHILMIQLENTHEIATLFEALSTTLILLVIFVEGSLIIEGLYPLVT